MSVLMDEKAKGCSEFRFCGGSEMQDGQRGTPQKPPPVQQIEADFLLLLCYKINPKIPI